MTTDRLLISEIDALERLTTPAVHHKIQVFLRQGFTVEQIADSLAKRVKCSVRVARVVVWDAQDAEEFFFVGELP
jgi:hypothetical protein